MKKFIFMMLLLISISSVVAEELIEENIEGNYKYLKNKIIIKIKPEFAKDFEDYLSNGSRGDVILNEKFSQLKKVMSKFQIESTNKIFKNFIKTNGLKHDLSTIYKINYKNVDNLFELIDELKKNEIIEFAEPDIILKTNLSPNDTYYGAGNQWYMNNINAEQAWDSTTSDASLIIAIIDTGVDWDHEDLAANIWSNSAEIPNNGIDDDENGYVDDIRGWDWINNDNNPKDDNSHGTHVAGIAAAVTDNNKGIAGIAWNSKIMPLKVLQSTGVGTASDVAAAVDYARVNGANVINLSLGTYGESLTMKFALENAYSTSVIVASAGNDELDINDNTLPRPVVSFPAGYSFVLGVQASQVNNERAKFSNFDSDGPIQSSYPIQLGYNYELKAPGLNIYSTTPNNGYKYFSGTSMAAPVVSGAVALLKSLKPNLSNEEIFATLIQSSNYMGLIDIQKALNFTLKVNLLLRQGSTVNVNDTIQNNININGRINAGETVKIWTEIKNVGGLAKNVTAKIKLHDLEDPDLVTFIDDEATFGNISAYGTMSNYSNPFEIKIASNTAHNRQIQFDIEISATNTQDLFDDNFVINVENGEYLHGEYTGTKILTADKEYYVDNNVAFEELIINPGTTLRIKYGVAFQVCKLICNGTPDSLITFSGIDGSAWGQINLVSSGYCSQVFKSNWGNLVFKYTIFEDIEGYFEADFYNCIFKRHWGQIRSAIERNLFISREGLDCDYLGDGESYNVFADINASGYWYSFGYNALIEYTGFYQPAYRSSLGNLNLKSNTILSHDVKKALSVNGTPFVSAKLPSLYIGYSNINNIKSEIEWNGKGSINFDSLLIIPPVYGHGHIWQIQINNKLVENNLLTEPLGAGTYNFKVFYNRAMDTTIKPFFTFGVREPYTQRSISNGFWKSWIKDNEVGSTFYHLQVADNIYFNNPVFDNSGIQAVSYKVIDLDETKQYFWRVRYRNEFDDYWSSWSLPFSFYTKTENVPANPIVIFPKNKDVDLPPIIRIKWLNTKFISSTIIQLSKNSDFSNLIVNEQGCRDDRFIINGLEKSTTYYLRIKHVNFNGSSDWSDKIEFRTTDTLSDAPEVIYPTNESIYFGNNAKIYWKNLDWADKYQLTLLQKINIVNDTTLDTRLNYPCDLRPYYSYYTFTINGIIGEYSGFAKYYTFFTSAPFNKPSKVELNQPANNYHSDCYLVEFKWYMTDQANGYEIVISNDENFNSIIYHKTYDYFKDTSATFLFKNKDTIWWKVRANNGYDYYNVIESFGDWSDTRTVIFGKIPPLLCVPSDSAIGQNTEVVLKWNNAEGANTIYDAMYSADYTIDESTGDGFQRLRILGTRDNEKFETPIERKRFSFIIQAAGSASVNFYAIGGLGKIDLEWEMPVGQTSLGFNMYRSTSSDTATMTKINNALLTDTTYIDFDVVPGVTYFYRYKIVLTDFAETDYSGEASTFAYPSTLISPELLKPKNDSVNTPVDVTFSWIRQLGVNYFLLEISELQDFSSLAFSKNNIPANADTMQYLVEGLSNYKLYYWRVKSYGVPGVSPWSEVRTFITIPPLPEIPVLSFPDNNSVKMPVNITFTWNYVDYATDYHFQLALNPNFTNPIQDINNISTNSIGISNLEPAQTYYWRLRAKNVAGSSNWSEKWLFTTDTADIIEPPDTWAFTKNTGDNATILIPKSIYPKINGRNFLVGDAVGVFFKRNDSLICAGYSIWNNQNMNVTVWGDDEYTEIKDGFANGEKYTIKLWDSREKNEYPSKFTILSGKDYYSSNGFTILNQLESRIPDIHKVALNKGWNMISTYIKPEPDTLTDICKSIESNLVILKNNLGEVYIPSFGINQIGDWNYFQGYKIYLNLKDSIIISGEKVKPENEQLILSLGWNIVSYLRSSSRDIVNSLNTITNNLLIAKNNDGQVYIPSFDINTIGEMIPGQGYQMYMQLADTLIYPANSLGRASSGNITPTPEFLTPIYKETGNSSVAILQINSPNGDEIGVYNQNDELVGSGVVHNGYAALTVWGDNDQTKEIDGAKDNYELRIKSYEIKTGRLSDVMISDMVNYTNGEKLTDLNYKKDAVYFAKSTVENNKSNISLHVRPNPASEIIEIELETPDCKASELKLYSIDGKLISDLTDKLSDLSGRTISQNISSLTQGEYTIILTCGSERAMRKVVVMR